MTTTFTQSSTDAVKRKEVSIIEIITVHLEAT